jgi:hypothetical protein
LYSAREENALNFVFTEAIGMVLVKL